MCSNGGLGEPTLDPHHANLLEHGSFGDDHTEGAVFPQLRDFLQSSLYDTSQGYFTAPRANAPVGSVGRALAFPQLAGEDGYRRAVREVYDNLEVRIPGTGLFCHPTGDCYIE